MVQSTFNQSLCSYYKMLWSWSKKLGKIYWYVSGGIIKVKIHERGNSSSVRHTDDFIKYFRGVGFTTFHNCK